MSAQTADSRCTARQGDNSPTHLRCRLDAPHPGVKHQWWKPRTRPLEARTVTPITLTDTSAFITALEKDRVDWYVDHGGEPGITENAFERGWDAHRESTRIQVRQILDLLDGLRANDGMPYAQYSQLHDLVSGLGA